MSDAKSTSSADRALRVLIALKGHSITGISNKELAEGTRESAPNISRALAQLEAAGLATKLDNGRWAHSVTMLQIAHAHTTHLANLQDRITELNRRVVAGSL